MPFFFFLDFWRTMQHVLSLPIIERKEIAKDTVEVTFGLEDSKFPFEPGQYVRVSLDPSLVDPRGFWRDFMIASHPSERGVLRIAFRSSDRGVKKVLETLPLGSRVHVSGPYGTDLLPGDTSRPLVFIAGGIGITAFLNKIVHSANHGGSRGITLLWEDRSPDRFAYLPLLATIAEASGGRFNLVRMAKDRLDEDFIKSNVPDLSKPLWQVAGSPRMVERVLGLLKNSGVPEVNIGDVIYGGYEKREQSFPKEEEEEEEEDPEEKKRLRALLEALNKIALISETDIYGNIVYVNDK